MKNGPYELIIAPPNYPGKRYRDRYAYEHTVVYWQEHAVLPVRGEIIHHINEDRRDNRIENLRLMRVKDHAQHHAPPPKMWRRKCPACQKFFKRNARKMRQQIRVNPSKRVFCSRECGAKAPKLFQSKQGLGT